MSRSLTNKEIQESIRLMEERVHNSTPEESRRRLIDAGILLEDGTIAPRYNPNLTDEEADRLCMQNDKV